MENDKNKKDAGGIKDVLITIVSVLVYIVYKLVIGFTGFIKSLKKRGALTVIGVLALIVFAIIFWPLTLAVILSSSGVVLVFVFILYSHGLFDP